MEDSLDLGLELASIVGKTDFVIAGDDKILYQLVLRICIEVGLGFLLIRGIKTKLVDRHLLFVEGVEPE